MDLEWSSLWTSGTPMWLGPNAKLLTLSSHRTPERSCSLPAPRLERCCTQDQFECRSGPPLPWEGQEGVAHSASTEIQILNPLLNPDSFLPTCQSQARAWGRGSCSSHTNSQGFP